MKNNKPLELVLRNFFKELQCADLKNTKPFDGIFEVTDENGHTRKIALSPKSTLGDVKKMVREVQKGEDPRVVNDRAQDLLELILKKYPYNDAVKLIKRMETLSNNEGKIKQVCKLHVDDKGNISFICPDGEMAPCQFESI